MSDLFEKALKQVPENIKTFVDNSFEMIDQNHKKAMNKQIEITTKLTFIVEDDDTERGITAGFSAGMQEFFQDSLQLIDIDIIDFKEPKKYILFGYEKINGEDKTCIQKFMAIDPREDMQEVARRYICDMYNASSEGLGHNEFQTGDGIFFHLDGAVEITKADFETFNKYLV